MCQLRCRRDNTSQSVTSRPLFASTSRSVSLLGACKNGDNCSFAHSPDELRDAPKPRHHENPQRNGGESEILAQQLNFIIAKLTELYPQNENVHYYLKNASELLRAFNIELAADTLHKILNNPDLIAINKTQHDNIVEEAKNYGKYVEANWQQMKSNMQMPGPSYPPQFGGPMQPNLMFADPNRHHNSGNAYKEPNFNNKGIN